MSHNHDPRDPAPAAAAAAPIAITATAKEWKDYEFFAKIGALYFQNSARAQAALHAHEAELDHYFAMSHKVHIHLLKLELEETAQERKAAA